MDNNKMLDYFLEQPQKLAQLYEESRMRTQGFCDYWLENKPDRLYLIGSGTSYHAITTASKWVEAFLGTEVTVASPTSLPAIRGSRPAIMLVSQSGASTNTLQAAEQLKGHDLIALTGEEESPLHSYTSAQLNLGIGRETAGPKTVGYTATVLFLLLAALYSGKTCEAMDNCEFEDVFQTFSQAVDAVQGNIERTRVWFERNAHGLATIRKYVVVGKGSAAAVAGEGALKILETVRIPAVGYEFEEYLHGPILQIDRDLGGIYYICGDEDRPRMEALADLHATESHFVFKVDGGKQQNSVDPKDLHLVMTGKEYTQGIELIYPCQMIGAGIPQLANRGKGRDFLKEYEAMHRIKACSHEGNSQ